MQRYLETRTTDKTSTAAADIARHLLARQHLGKAVVLCDKPVTTMSVTKKYWLKLARILQKERASTLNVERILQLTHDITRMHHLEFVAKPYCDSPQADVFFMTPSQADELPAACFSLYVIEPPSEAQLQHNIAQLPDRSLVIDYTHSKALKHAPLLPKHVLERTIPDSWCRIEEFLEQRNIDIARLAQHPADSHLIDHAIDDLLDTSSHFLRLADDFLELLSLVQPTHTTMTEQRQYSVLTTLTRRVHALTPGSLMQQFINSLGDDDASMLLHDAAVQKYTLVLTG